MTAQELLALDRVLIIAHRGDSRVAPENTLPAFVSALRLGVDAVELDYLHSADSVPVVFHDDELDRLTDACKKWGGERIPLRSKSLAELRELDAGEWFDPQFSGTRISTLEEALALVCPRAVLMVERKDGDAATCINLLERMKCTRCVVLAAFDWRFLADCRALSPEVVLEALGEGQVSSERLNEARSLGAALVGWNQEDLRAPDIRLIHEAGLRAWSWTVDDIDRARELRAWGLDGLITNVPGLMQRLVTR